MKKDTKENEYYKKENKLKTKNQYKRKIQKKNITIQKEK